ncbi:hypothetical protein [Streptomyces sp. NPDC091209]|uniref:hypothetical protein n=1 Tax=Streptomyces sp. NPDC091209 TaxID=3365974 RepID=UPI0037FCA982
MPGIGVRTGARILIEVGDGSTFRGRGPSERPWPRRRRPAACRPPPGGRDSGSRA